jgi:hypothetical protein
MYYVNQDIPKDPTTKPQKRKRMLIDGIIGLNEIYYQCLYYFSGIIIIGCSYRWSLFGLAIIVLTILGLLISFSKKLIVAILFLNLSYLFLNYSVIMLNKYPGVVNVVGEDLLDAINKVALFVGFHVKYDGYATLFILNIVIFYFCVLCYSLATVLNTTVRDGSIMPGHMEPAHNELKESLRGNLDDFRSMAQKSVL